MSDILLGNELYLHDREFLHDLDLVHNKVIYAKIISLTFDEDPVEEIQGRVTQGNVSVDGQSSLRRTCSVSLVANEFNIHEYYWGLNTKFKFYIGVQNDINKNYPNIIWFKMGTYLITSFSTSQQVNSWTISIQGKDKMCLLNGEVGGIITPLSWDFGTIENIQEDGSKILEKYLIKNIITEAVHEHAREPFWNIVVNDLDDLALELLEYRGDKTMYLLYDIDKDIITQFFIPQNDTDELNDDLCATKTVPSATGPVQTLDESIKRYADVSYDPRVTAFKDFEQTYTRFWLKSGGNYITYTYTDKNGNSITKFNEFSLIKVSYGETIGYRLTDLIYPSDLISNVGESITSMLDKLVSMLGNYEYFYNLDGQFVFQRKPVYYEVSWNNVVKKRNVNYLPIPNGSTYDNTKSYAYLDGTLMHDYYTYDEESWDKWTSQDLMYEVVETENYADNSLNKERWSYSFTDDMLVTSFQNQPNLLNLRNDYSIWGTRKGISGADIPVHLRYAIDIKPKYYKTFDGIEYISKEGKQEVIDWYNEEIEKVRRKKTNAIVIPDGPNIFRKIKVPAYLRNPDGGSDWWDILNWADYYCLLTGDYPSQTLMTYRTEAFYGIIKFPDGDQEDCSRWGQLIFDTNRITHNRYRDEGQANRLVHNQPNSTTSWGAFQHGFSGCFHTYEQFIKLNTELTDPPMQSFIYKPRIPEGTYTLVDEDYYEIIDNGALDAEIDALITERDEYINSVEATDWRELIYQMAIDYRKHNHDEDFHTRIAANNMKNENLSYYPKGYTGYEPYYIDMEGFWRTLYNPDYSGSYQVAYVTSETFKDSSLIQQYYVYEKNTSPTVDPNKTYFYKDYLGRYVELSKKNLDILQQKLEESINNETDFYYYIRTLTINDEYDSQTTYYKKIDDEFDTETYWAKEVTENPSGLNFWFDFLENNSELDRYSVQFIGDRPKAENDSDVKAIYFRDIPDVIFVDASTTNERIRQEEEQRPGYEFVRLPEYLDELFSVSRQGKSAIDKLDTFLYNYACCTESITMNTIPVYYLEPNTRIFVHDENSGIDGEYLINRLSIPLSNTGTMSISATKALERLY